MQEDDLYMVKEVTGYAVAARGKALALSRLNSCQVALGASHYPQGALPRMSSHSMSWEPSKSQPQFLQQEFADTGGVRLAAGGFHDRADDRASSLDFAALDLLDNIGVRGNSFVNGGV